MIFWPRAIFFERNTDFLGSKFTIFSHHTLTHAYVSAHIDFSIPRFYFLPRVPGPILLYLGMLPQVAAATSATTVLISSSAAALNFYAIGLLLEDYAGWYMAIGFIATLFGATLVSYLIRKYNRTSIIIIVIVVLIAIATILLLVVGTLQLIKDIKTGEHLSFTGYCPKAPVTPAPK